MKKNRIAGIDYGNARIGLALSDPSQILASPLKMVPVQKKMEETAKEVLKILEAHEIEEIVIGMPYSLDGKIGFSADNVLHFIELLKKHTSLKITTWDERLTTQQTERVMKSGNVSRKKRTKIIDSACATLILQSYLDQKQFTLIPAYD